MARANGSYQRETIAVIVGVILLFVLLILRNGGNYYMNYLHQDASRAQFEIDQSYVLLISQAEGFSQPKVENQDRYNATLVHEFKNKFIEKPTFLVKDDFEKAKKIEFGIHTTEDKALSQLLRDKRDGFFIHCCHFDSESLSKASKLKMTRGWESLIMEGDPRRYEALKSQLRTYSIVNAMLSEKANFSIEYLIELLKMKKGAFSKLKNVITDGGSEHYETGPGNMTVVPDFPLGFVAKTFGRTEVDLLVLKAKGRELGILKAIVLDDCEVHVIEVQLGNSGEKIENFLTQNGYLLYEVDNSNGFGNANNAIFYSEKVVNSKKAESVFPLLEQLQKAKLNKQQSSQSEDHQI